LTTLTPQLARIAVDLTEAGRRAHVLADPLDQEGWARRPAPGEWSVEPPVFLRTKTTAPFVPQGAELKTGVIDAFDLFQNQMIGCLGEANGLDLGRLHLKQAEEVVRGPRPRSAS